MDKRGFRITAWLRVVSLLVSASLLLIRSDWAICVLLAALLLSFEPMVWAFRGSHGTALRAAVVWGWIALGLAVISQLFALSDPLSEGKPVSGHVTYLATLATLAALISVLNARTPGGTAWAILMALLVLVFLIPWLEGPGLGGARGGLGRLRLDAPWSIFYGLLVLAGVTNYLPTRFGPAVAWVGLGLGLEFIALTQIEMSAASRGLLWSALPWTLAASITTAERLAARRIISPMRVEAIWFWFRDHWGVVWALRVKERFDRTAETLRWPFRLSWHGLEPIGGIETSQPNANAAEATLKSLLRRFATVDRIEEVLADDASPPCHAPNTDR